MLPELQVALAEVDVDNSRQLCLTKTLCALLQLSLPNRKREAQASGGTQVESGELR